MHGFELTSLEVQSLRTAHRGCREKRLADRIKAVILLGTGWTVVATAQALLLDEDTVHKYVQLYQQGGVELLLTMHYQGSLANLSPKQLKALDKHLMKNIYIRARDVVAYVEEAFGVIYTVQGMTDLFHGWCPPPT